MKGGCGVRITHEALHGSIEIRAAVDLSASNFAMPDGETTSIRIDGAWFSVLTDPYQGSGGGSPMLDHESGTQICCSALHCNPSKSPRSNDLPSRSASNEHAEQQLNWLIDCCRLADCVPH